MNPVYILVAVVVLLILVAIYAPERDGMGRGCAAISAAFFTLVLLAAYLFRGSLV